MRWIKTLNLCLCSNNPLKTSVILSCPRSKMPKVDSVNKLAITLTLHFHWSSLSNRAFLFEVVKMAQEFRTRENNQPHACTNSILAANIDPLWLQRSISIDLLLPIKIEGLLAIVETTEQTLELVIQGIIYLKQKMKKNWFFSCSWIKAWENNTILYIIFLPSCKTLGLFTLFFVTWKARIIYFNSTKLHCQLNTLGIIAAFCMETFSWKLYIIPYKNQLFVHGKCLKTTFEGA